MNLSKFAKYSWFVLIFTIVVILWGGYVSASGAGDGCGESWPLCADIATREETGVTSMDTFIELFHRATSGLSLIAVVVMYIWSRRIYPKTDGVRKVAFWSLIFIIGESLFGAAIVIFRLVAENESLYRAFSQPTHLVNTYLLLASLVLTAWWASGNPQLGKERPAKPLLLLCLIGFLILSGFGTIASLATTIFPSESFIEGVQKDFTAGVHYLIRLRVLHPLIATLWGGLLWVLYKRLPSARSTAILPNLLLAGLVLYGIQYAFGVLNAVMLAPIWLQLSHLLVSDLLWMCLVLITAEHWSRGSAFVNNSFKSK